MESLGKQVWGTSRYISSPLDLFLCYRWIHTPNVWILSLAWAYQKGWIWAVIRAFVFISGLNARPRAVVHEDIATGRGTERVISTLDLRRRTNRIMASWSE